MTYQEIISGIIAGALFLALAAMTNTVFNPPQRTHRAALQAAPAAPPATTLQGTPCAAAGGAGRRLTGGVSYGR